MNDRTRLRIASDVAELHGQNNLTKDTALTEQGAVVEGVGDTPNRHDILTGTQADGTALPAGEDRTCRNRTYNGPDGAAMLGHSDRRGTADTEAARSWNASHLSRGSCSQEALRSTGGHSRLLQVLVTATALVSSVAGAQSVTQPVKIGVLADMTSIYSAIGGRGLLEAAQMAIEDLGGSVLGKPVELVSSDTQNKVDVASSRARQWLDAEGVDMITDLPSSGIALAVSKLGQEKKKIVMVTSAATSELTGKSCSPYTVHWTYDTYSLARSTGASVVKAGGDSWYFLSADYAFGQALERDATDVIKEGGGKVLGTSRHPLGASDFSSFLLQAQSSKAKVIGLANGGQDTVNSIKQAAEFGLVKGGQKLAALLMFLTDVKAIGLPLAQGLMLTEAFYWDQNDKTREWSQRFYKRTGSMPTMTQAGTYGAVMHYLKAVKEAGTKDPDKVMAKMRDTPINDFMTTNGKLRIDGRVLRDMHLYQVKTPAESKGEWDLYKTVGTVSGDTAFRPLSEGGCSLAK